MQNELPYEYTLESLSSPALYRPNFISSSIDAAGGIYSAPRLTTCPGPTPMSCGKRCSPDNLLSVDAPTQPRNYRIPSSTSRKVIPSSFSNKRNPPTRYSEGEEDELEEEHRGIPSNDQEEIEKRRRKNTIAARKSRMKKLEQRIALEQAVERLTTEREVWKTRALTLQSLLTSHGIPCPDFND
jgi:hypothetical protein